MCKFVINVKEILANLTKVKTFLPKNTKVCAVIKANAYGFGSVKMARLLSKSVDYFAVARLCEFMKINELNLKLPCLILSPLNEKENRVAIKNGAEITISTSTNIIDIQKHAEKNGQKAKVHIKLDTGMNRYGIKTERELTQLLKQLKLCKNIEVVGAFTHVYDARNSKNTLNQRHIFIRFRKIIESFGFKPLYHFANSIALRNKENCFDMVRLGFDLYSGKHISEHKFTTFIREIKSIEKGEIVSYNANFKAKKHMQIAVCGAGYADGISRKLSKKGFVLIEGERAKILGDICMDSFMVDVSNIPKAKIDSEVVIFGKSGESYISVCDIARICDTIPYEIYTNISQRVKRVYVWGKKCRLLQGNIKEES